MRAEQLSKNNQLELIGTESEDRLDKKICPWDAINMYAFDEGVERSKFSYVKGVHVTTAMEKRRHEEEQLDLYRVTNEEN